MELGAYGRTQSPSIGVVVRGAVKRTPGKSVAQYMTHADQLEEVPAFVGARAMDASDNAGIMMRMKMEAAGRSSVRTAPENQVVYSAAEQANTKPFWAGFAGIAGASFAGAFGQSAAATATRQDVWQRQFDKWGAQSWPGDFKSAYWRLASAGRKHYDLLVSTGRKQEADTLYSDEQVNRIATALRSAYNSGDQQAINNIIATYEKMVADLSTGVLVPAEGVLVKSGAGGDDVTLPPPSGPGFFEENKTLLLGAAAVLGVGVTAFIVAKRRK